MTKLGERVRLVATGWDTDLAYEISEAPPPTPHGHEVLIEVFACGVCHRDIIDRSGRFPFQQVPITPGHEAAGRVLAIGADVRAFAPGDHVATMHRDACGECPRCRAGETSLCDRAGWVFGILSDGGYARHLLSPDSALYLLPPSMPGPEAAIFHCTFGTAYRDLKTLGGLRAGETVLITGANGGVGTAAVQIAARLGAEVYAAVRSEEHVLALKALGAHHVIVNDGKTIHEALGTRVDLVLETVGAAVFPSALRAARIGGRVVIIGNILAEKVALNLGYVITSGLSIIGGSGATRREMAELLAMHREQPFVFQIDRVLPLAQADAAQRLVRSGGIRGRVVLTPGA